MITEQDLQEAIAECLGQRNPNASTCIKLAAFYTIRKELFGEQEPVETYSMPMYSGAAPVEQVETHVSYNSDSEFSRAVNGMKSERVWQIIDELMDTIRIVNPRLYTSVMDRIEEG